MIKLKIISAVILTIVLVAILFDVELAPSTESEVPDPAVEAQYQACYAEKDEQIHTTAFGTIDNPDVQKEFITSNRARAAAECRAEFPQVIIPAADPVRIRLVNLTPRFW